jgi:hypothetical protein
MTLLAEIPTPCPLLEILKNYITVTFYECAISAQYTPNNQILYEIQTIITGMEESTSQFGKTFSEDKALGTALIIKHISAWLKTQSLPVQTFFQTHAIKNTTLLNSQRNLISCTINNKVERLSIETDKDFIVIAIDLLRYPYVVMERLQRIRQGPLLDFEVDALALIDFAKKFHSIAQEMKGQLAKLV